MNLKRNSIALPVAIARPAWPCCRASRATLLAVSCLFPFLSAQAQAVATPAPDLNHLQKQVADLSSRLDSTSYLVVSLLLIVNAAACLWLWTNARSFRAFRSAGVWFAAVALVLLCQFLHVPDSWRWSFSILSSLLIVEMGADVLGISKGRWVWLNRVPCGAALLFAWSTPLQLLSRATVDLSNLFLFVLLIVGFRRGNLRIRQIAAALTVVWFFRLPIEPIVHRYVPYDFEIGGWRWNFTPIAMVLFGLVAVAFFIRELMDDQREKERLAAELAAGRAVQQVLIPEETPFVPGFNIHSVYKPFGEVGGDFFQVLPIMDDSLPSGVLVIIGDVSGKGMPAAMTVSLLVGTVRTLAHYTHSPGEILAAMNQRMLVRSRGGFTTCLVLRADTDGMLTIANAGHIAPYIDGKELRIKTGLPLGISADTIYEESNFQLSPEQQLTLLTDGVIEARDAAGTLLGFERGASLSTQSAEAIAQAAQTFGQEDDITVLSLARRNDLNPALE
jgi:hypothetical protein